MKFSNITIMASVSLLITACASMERTGYYEPSKNDSGWSQTVNKKGFFEFGDVPPDLTYKCDETAITFQSTKIMTVGSFGPPLIPFPFPVIKDEAGKDKTNVDLKFYSPNNKTKVINASIIMKTETLEPIEKLGLETKENSTSMFRYVYRLNWKNVESFILKLETSDASCGILSVPYTRQFHVTYSML